MRTMPQPKKLPWSLRCGKFRRSTDHQNISKALVRTRFDTTAAAPPGTLRTNTDKPGRLVSVQQSRFSSAGSRGAGIPPGCPQLRRRLVDLLLLGRLAEPRSEEHTSELQSRRDL